MQFIPEIERAPLAEQRAFQVKKLLSLLEYVHKHSPFYQQLYAQHDIDLRDIQSLDDLAKLPFTTKEDLQLHWSDMVCVPPSAIREYTATSGTLGHPVTIALTARDLERLAYNEYLSFNSMAPGNTYQLMLTLDRQFMAGMAYYTGLQKSSKAVVRTGPAIPAMQWEVIHRLQTDTLVAVPSFLLKMIEYAQENNIDLANSPVKQVLAIGESLRDAQLQPAALAKKIQEAWPIELYGTYASTEMQTAFTECSHFVGGHHHPELIIVEILDEDGNAVSEEAYGEVTITTLDIEAMPLVRYKTGDICRAYYEPCACGRKTMRLGPIIGRKAQMIKYKGTSLYPSAIANALHEHPFVMDYAIEVSHDATQQDQVILHVQSSLAVDAIAQQLRSVLQHKIRVVPQFQFHDTRSMQQILFAHGGRKPNRFIDRRKC